MKILYAIQGTGNGHIARAEDVVPILQGYGDVDLLVSGAQADITPPFDVKYNSKGLSFYFGRNGGVDLVKTIKKNRSKDVFREIKSFPVEKYDLVINDFEPISAWAAKIRHIPCVGLSHQASLLSAKVPRPRHYDPVGTWILKNYAPTDNYVGFHFQEYDQNIFTPVIRSRVRNMKPGNKDHFTVYLPAYEEKKLLPLLCSFPEIQWHVFSKHTRVKYSVGKLSVFPIDNESFTLSMATSRGVLCGAGFETPAEALYLRKKLMVIPMKQQYEQHCNAEALRQMGVPVLKKLKKKHRAKLAEWLDDITKVNVNFMNTTQAAVERALSLRQQV